MRFTAQQNVRLYLGYLAKNLNGAGVAGLGLSDFNVTLSLLDGTNATEPVSLSELNATSLPGHYEFSFIPVNGTTYVFDAAPTYSLNAGELLSAHIAVAGYGISNLAALCTTEQVKLYLGGFTNITSEDDILDELCTAATETITRYLGYEIGQKSRIEYPRGGGRELVLRHRPVDSVSAIYVSSSFPRTYDGTTLLSADDYAVDEDSGLVQIGSGTWPDGIKSVRVDYTSGWSSIPADINRAAIRTAALWYMGRKYVGIAGASLGDGSVTRYEHDRLPVDVRMILDHLRDPVVR